MLLLPLRVEALMLRHPWMNIGIVTATCLVFGLVMFDAVSMAEIESLILEDLHPAGLFGHLLVHADLLHLGGNMIFLWVFGNAICSKLGNLSYLALYLLVGLGAALAHLLLDGAPAVGASGAINGIIGFYIALHPVNRIHCFWWFWLSWGVIEVRGFWLVLLWLAFDLWGAFGELPGVAYWAHLGGLASGFGLGVGALLLGWVKMTEYDNETVPDLFLPRHE